MVTADADLNLGTQIDPVQPDPSPPGDAGGEPAADAAVADIEQFLETRQGKEGDTAATEPTQEGAKAAADPVDAELEAARSAAAADAAEKADKEARESIRLEQAERDAQAARQAQERAFQANYQNRMREAGQEAYQLAIESGLSEADAQARGQTAMQRFNSHHADGLRLYEPAARRMAAEAVQAAWNTNVAEMLGADAPKFFGTDAEPKAYRNQGEALKALQAIWQEGRMTAAEVKAHTTREVVAYKAHLIKTYPQIAAILGTASGSSPNGDTPGRSYSSEHELNIAFNNNELSRESYAAEYKRLTGREP